MNFFQKSFLSSTSLLPLAVADSYINVRSRRTRFWLACFTSLDPSAAEAKSPRLQRPVLRRIELTLSPQPSFTTSNAINFALLIERPCISVDCSIPGACTWADTVGSAS
jgi:hypothetical protein